MSYVLVTIESKSDEYWYLENPEGERIAEYESRPSHPVDTVNDVLEDIDDPMDAVKYHLTRDWAFRTERE